MTRFKIPKRTGTHRIAALALYRAVLTQCHASPLEPAQKASLANIVRNRFRAPRVRRLRLALALESGYTALDLLDDAVAGNAASKAKLEDLISRAPLKLTLPPQSNVNPRKPKGPGPPPEEHRFLNVFPRQTVEGVRRVPYLVNANGVPFIRFKKPQPERLSGVIRHLIRKRNQLFHGIERMEEELIPLARWEDEWDVIVQRATGQMVGEPSEDTWQKSASSVHEELMNRMKEDRYRVYQRIGVYTDIILKERELAAKEEAEREQNRS